MNIAAENPMATIMSLLGNAEICKFEILDFTKQSSLVGK